MVIIKERQRVKTSIEMTRHKMFANSFLAIITLVFASSLIAGEVATRQTVDELINAESPDLPKLMNALDSYLGSIEALVMKKRVTPEDLAKLAELTPQDVLTQYNARLEVITTKFKDPDYRKETRVIDLPRLDQLERKLSFYRGCREHANREFMNYMEYTAGFMTAIDKGIKEKYESENNFYAKLEQDFEKAPLEKFLREYSTALKKGDVEKVIALTRHYDDDLERFKKSTDEVKVFINKDGPAIIKFCDAILAHPVNWFKQMTVEYEKDGYKTQFANKALLVRAEADKALEHGFVSLIFKDGQWKVITFYRGLTPYINKNRLQ